jgi:aminoglycoside 6'-N-acetyltransferase I
MKDTPRGNYRITNLLGTDVEKVKQTAEILLLAFQWTSPDSWPNMESALAEVSESLGPGRISRVVVDAEGKVLGWVAAIRQYGGNTWELHPIAVHPNHQAMGIGTSLVQDLLKQVASIGGETVWLGADDEINRTSLGGQALYPDVLAKLTTIQNLGGHPFEFFQKVGFVIVGVIPDANGIGKPDILMARRVRD